MNTDKNDYPDFIRASGDCICHICEKEYRKHRLDSKYLDWENRPYLNTLCDGTLVKL